jgi:hypothetical protein
MGSEVKSGSVPSWYKRRWWTDYGPTLPMKVMEILQCLTLRYPLNAELNPICHLLILLEDLTFMGTCIVSIFQYISNKMQRYTVSLYLETAVHVCGCYGVRHPQHTQTSSNSSTIAADSSNGVTNTRCCRYSCMRFWWWVEVPPETCRAVSRYK